MAGVTGLEPAASGVTGRRSNQLSYTPLCGASSGPEKKRDCSLGNGLWRGGYVGRASTTLPHDELSSDLPGSCEQEPTKPSKGGKDGGR